MVRIAEVLPRLIAKYGIQQRAKIDEINSVWKEIIGEPYASVTRVIAINRGQLEIAVPHNAFVQELSFRQAEFLEKLRPVTGNAKIKKLKFVVLDLTR